MSGMVNLLKKFFICLLYSKRLVCQIYSGINSYMNFFKDHLNLSNNIYDNAQILKAAEIKKQQEVIDRNPTTKYYQSLAQNLQEQVQYLKRMLNEADTPPPTQGVPSQEEMTDQERRDLYDIGRMRDRNPPPTRTPKDPNIPPPPPGGLQIDLPVPIIEDIGKLVRDQKTVQNVINKMKDAIDPETNNVGAPIFASQADRVATGQQYGPNEKDAEIHLRGLVNNNNPSTQVLNEKLFTPVNLPAPAPAPGLAGP